MKLITKTLIIGLSLILSGNAHQVMAQFFDADLTISNLSYSYNNNTQTFTSVTYDMNNISTVDGFEQVTNGLYLTDGISQEYLLDAQLSTNSIGLSAQSSETFTISNVSLNGITGLTKGTYFLAVAVDDFDEEVEEDEFNNILMLSGSSNEIPFGLYDIEATAGGLNYDFMTAVLSVLNFDVKNNGPNGAPANAKCELFLTGVGQNEYLIGTTNTGTQGINSGQTEAITFSDVDLDNINGLPTGTYFLKIIVDSDNKLDEENEGNNTWTLTGPDVALEFESLSVPTSTENMEHLADMVKIYPNPFNNIVYITELQQVDNIKIFDITGTIVRHLDKNSLANQFNTISIDMSDLAGGTYIVEITGGNTAIPIRKKVVKLL